MFDLAIAACGSFGFGSTVKRISNIFRNMALEHPRPAFDFTMLAENWGEDISTQYQRILALFQGEAARHCAGAEAAMQQQDRQSLLRCAHFLAGSSGNVCAMSLYASAAALERAAPAAPWAELQALYAAMAGDWQRVDTVIKSGGPLGAM
jgi:HPt (histidine-containing phosphotransfer) domain-containing protein